MKGLFVQFAEKPEAEMLSRRAMALLAGISVVYGFKGVWAQKNGRWRASEKRSPQEIRDVWDGGRAR